MAFFDCIPDAENLNVPKGNDARRLTFEGDVMRPRILIVEDEPAIADTIQYALETDGFDAIVMLRGAPALELLGCQPIDLVILDIGLPDTNGLELCKQIRRMGNVPVIFLTARNDEIDRVVGLEIGADDYIAKPFSPRELTARVKAVLRRSRSTDPPAGAPEVFSVDTAKRRISFFGCLLELSRTEYDILLTFIRRPGQVFTRDQLMEAVWDAPESSMDRTVDAHIKNLRAKLRAARADIDPIVTHRGTGYALREDL